MKKIIPNPFVKILIFLLIVLGSGAIGFIVGSHNSNPQERSIVVRAFKYGYDPEIIRVNHGDLVRLRFISEDVTHGFYLEGYDLNIIIIPFQSKFEVHRPSQPEKKEIMEEITFLADREGKFRYRCSKTCGNMHPFMLGELIVEPNRLLPTSLGLAIGILLGSFIMVILRKGNSENVNNKE